MLSASTRKRFVMLFVGVTAVVACAVAVVGCRSLSYIHSAPEDSEALWMASLKHQEGPVYHVPVYYVGSDGDYSYFRAGTLFYTRYKAQTAKLRLPRTFPFGRGEPYLVTEDMVPKY